METIPMEDREGYLEAMEKLRLRQSVELTAPLQNSIEVGETSKGELYIKSIKMYFGAHDTDPDHDDVVSRLFRLYDITRQEINARKG